MSEGPAPARGDPIDDYQFCDDEEPECDGCCEDEFCGANCPMEFGHYGPHLCEYHEWVEAGCPEPMTPRGGA